MTVGSPFMALLLLRDMPDTMRAGGAAGKGPKHAISRKNCHGNAKRSRPLMRLGPFRPRSSVRLPRRPLPHRDTGDTVARILARDRSPRHCPHRSAPRRAAWLRQWRCKHKRSRTKFPSWSMTAQYCELLALARLNASSSQLIRRISSGLSRCPPVCARSIPWGQLRIAPATAPTRPA